MATATSAQLRAEIDSGKTGDKVAGFDPAAAPLGLDFEAAGTPPTPEQIQIALQAETKDPLRKDARDDRAPGHAWLLIAFVLLFAGGLIGCAFWMN